jgi:mRNA interferase MazF
MMVIRSGTIYWINLNNSGKGQAAERRPFLTIQNDILNDSRLNTVVMLALTAKPEFGRLPGNVPLEKGEADLSDRYIVNVSQIKAVDKQCVLERIGALTEERMDQVYEGVKLVMGIG